MVEGLGCVLSSGGSALMRDGLRPHDTKAQVTSTGSDISLSHDVLDGHAILDDDHGTANVTRIVSSSEGAFVRRRRRQRAV